MSAAALSVDQGAALLWLRQMGGLADFGWNGNVTAEGRVCPFVLANFETAARLGFIEVIPAFADSDLLFNIHLLDAGRSFPIEPESERRLDALLRRFDD